MRIGIATDHGGFGLKQDLITQLRAAGYDVVDFGAHSLTTDDDYPDFQHGIDLGDPDIAFGLPHTIRDNVPFRWQPSQSCNEENYPNTNGPYRIAAGFPMSLNTSVTTNATGAYNATGLHANGGALLSRVNNTVARNTANTTGTITPYSGK